MYARPLQESEALSFGVSGKLWRQTLVLFDRQTRSLWSQHSHRAIAGPLVGSELETLGSEVTDWRSWRKKYPASTVMDNARDVGGSVLGLSLWAVVGLLGLWVALRIRRSRCPRLPADRVG